MNRWQIVNALLSLTLLAGAAFTAQPVQVFVTVTACSALATVLGMSGAIARGRQRHWHFDTGLFAAGWRFAARAYIVLLLGFLMQRAAVAVLVIFSDPHEIGMYSIAAQILDVLIIVPCGFTIEQSERDLALLHWGSLRAVRNGRVSIIDGSQFFNPSA